MLPTNCHAESRGSCVSVSSVIIYFILGKTALSPDTAKKASSVPPRKSRFNSPVFLACAHIPFQIRSARFHRRGAMKRKKGNCFFTPVIFPLSPFYFFRCVLQKRRASAGRLRRCVQESSASRSEDSGSRLARNRTFERSSQVIRCSECSLSSLEFTTES